MVKYTRFAPGVGVTRGAGRIPGTVATDWGIEAGERMNPQAALSFPLPHFDYNHPPFSLRGACWPRQAVASQPEVVNSAWPVLLGNFEFALSGRTPFTW